MPDDTKKSRTGSGGTMGSTILLILASFVTLSAMLYKPVSLRLEVLGVFRRIENVHGEDLRLIPDTVYCEDLHYHRPSDLLFTACEGEELKRFAWFPPLANIVNHKAAGRGSIYVIDPKTFKSKRLSLTGFSGSFVTHGIDVVTSEDDPTSVNIYAVNHLPNPAYFQQDRSDADKKHIRVAQSQVEVFRHTIGSSEAIYIRSVWHPLIRTPNDLLITGPRSFYVTNDHYYREGFMRDVEDFGFQELAPWTDLVHVEFSEKAIDPSTEVNATIAAQGIHNNNGIGRGHADSDILIVDSAAGVLVRAERVFQKSTRPELTVVERVQLPSSLDNPSYFEDPFPEFGHDASGYILAGLARSIDMIHTRQDPHGIDPVVVWQVGRETSISDRRNISMIFQDDGSIIRTASAAVLIAIDPSENQGKKQAWLFVTGFLSRAMIATKVSL